MGIHQRPPVEEEFGLVGLEAEKTRAEVGCSSLAVRWPCWMSSSLFASQQPDFAHIFSLLSADLSLLSVFFPQVES